MSRLRVAIDISATPAQVWDVVEPIEDHVQWMHDAVAIRFRTDRHRGAGTTFLCDTKVGPFELVDSMEITEWEPGVAMGVRHVGVVTGTVLLREADWQFCTSLPGVQRSSRWHSA